MTSGSAIPVVFGVNPASLKLGYAGMGFSHFHAAAPCCPTRSMLMTGTDHLLTGLAADFNYAFPEIKDTNGISDPWLTTTSVYIGLTAVSLLYPNHCAMRDTIPL